MMFVLIIIFVRALRFVKKEDLAFSLDVLAGCSSMLSLDCLAACCRKITKNEKLVKKIPFQTEFWRKQKNCFPKIVNTLNFS